MPLAAIGPPCNAIRGDSARRPAGAGWEKQDAARPPAPGQIETKAVPTMASGCLVRRAFSGRDPGLCRPPLPSYETCSAHALAQCTHQATQPSGFLNVPGAANTVESTDRARTRPFPTDDTSISAPPFSALRAGPTYHGRGPRLYAAYRAGQPFAYSAISDLSPGAQAAPTGRRPATPLYSLRQPRSGAGPGHWSHGDLTRLLPHVRPQSCSLLTFWAGPRRKMGGATGPARPRDTPPPAAAGAPGHCQPRFMAATYDPACAAQTISPSTARPHNPVPPHPRRHDGRRQCVPAFQPAWRRDALKVMDEGAGPSHPYWSGKDLAPIRVRRCRSRPPDPSSRADVAVGAGRGATSDLGRVCQSYMGSSGAVLARLTTPHPLRTTPPPPPPPPTSSAPIKASPEAPWSAHQHGTWRLRPVPPTIVGEVAKQGAEGPEPMRPLDPPPPASPGPPPSRCRTPPPGRPALRA